MNELSKLPYGYADLEPFIDAHTLGLHYHKHQQNYLNNLNKILKENNYPNDINLITLANNINAVPIKIQNDLRFNLGGVINHNLYFNNIGPTKQLPSGKLLEKINNMFGNYENFTKEFKNSALSLKGSGYTFLIMDSDRNIQIINLPNQESPYFYHLTPLLTIDMWEHAYYLNYKNKKDLYIDNFFEIINFEWANNLYNN